MLMPLLSLLRILRPWIRIRLWPLWSWIRIRWIPWILWPWIRIRSRIRILRLNFCLTSKFLKAIFPPIIELSIYQTRLPPNLTYIQKKVKNIWTKSKKFDFFKTSGPYRSNYDIRDIQLSIIVILFELLKKTNKKATEKKK